MNKTLLKLEYNKILDLLCTYCKTYIGKEKILQLRPCNTSITVQSLLNQTTEANTLLNKYGKPPITDIPNVDIIIKSIESNNTLSAKNLLQITHILKLSRELKSYFYDNELNSSDYPIMNSIFEQLYSNIGIEQNIFNSILDENNIADTASKELNTLRTKRKNLELNIKNKLNSIIHSSSYSKFIMEPIITIRNDRYVIPVKVEYKDNLKGLVHDISFSGSTVYIEPITIFDINNEINNIKAEETIEIEKILQHLSSLLFPIIDNIKTNINCIGDIDFCFAKAQYSNDILGISPIINTEKKINLIDARHPLIDKDTVVPITINLGIDFNCLIITGPNTGGKTVTLKTVGLLCLMACSGLHIPAKENSSIFVFDNIFTDIGDEQSIAESLSTFSAHITNIVDILSCATSNSLVLVDELGSGTDPIQGASLAISILEHFYNIGALVLATTHYSEIKNYALITSGFENASSEFDIETLKPTYRLIIGVPGKSNAFAISRRLGLSEEIINRANDFLTTDTINIEELLKNIYDNKLKIDKEKEEINKNLNQISALRRSLENESSSLSTKQKEIIENAKIKAREILLNAKQEADDIIKDLNILYDNADTNTLSKSEFKDSLKQANLERTNLNSNITNLSSNLDYSGEDTNNAVENIKPGIQVFVPSLNSNATVLSYPNKSGDVQIQIGSAKMNLNSSKLQQLSVNSKNTNIAKSKNVNTISKSKTVSSEINVIGQNVDEAIFVIDKYLDDCAIANLGAVRIVHGKGTGKLRSGIHTFLKTHPHVKSFRLGTFGEGEMGVTVVDIK